MEYHLKYMAPEDLDRVYPLLERDFADDERKRCGRLRALMESGMEVGWFLMANGQEAGYAFIVRHPAVPFVLLDYIATERHGRGDGTALLALLKNEYLQGILAEVDDPEQVPEGPERALRARRLHFYRRAGFAPCPFENEIYTVRYLVHLWSPIPPEHPVEAAARALDTLYALQLPEEEYRANVFIGEAPAGDL